MKVALTVLAVIAIAVPVGGIMFAFWDATRSKHGKHRARLR